MIDPSSLTDTDRGRWLEHTSDYAMRCVGQLLDWSEDYLFVSFDDSPHCRHHGAPMSLAVSRRLSCEFAPAESREGLVPLIIDRIFAVSPPTWRRYPQCLNELRE